MLLSLAPLCCQCKHRLWIRFVTGANKMAQFVSLASRNAITKTNPVNGHKSLLMKEFRVCWQAFTPACPSTHFKAFNHRPVNFLLCGLLYFSPHKDVGCRGLWIVDVGSRSGSKKRLQPTDTERLWPQPRAVAPENVVWWRNCVTFVWWKALSKITSVVSVFRILPLCFLSEPKNTEVIMSVCQ